MEDDKIIPYGVFKLERNVFRVMDATRGGSSHTTEALRRLEEVISAQTSTNTKILYAISGLRVVE